MSELTRYPLTWPAGWKRTESRRRKRGLFRDSGKNRVTISLAVERIAEELGRLALAKYDDILISTNVRPRLDGMLRSDQPEPVDPGAAVYWEDGKTHRCIAADLYDRVADNLAAIAATLDAMRAIERHGGAAILDRAFTGFIALPAPEQWFQVLNVSASATREQIELAYRRLAMEHHPDRGGDPNAMARINAARDDALALRR